MKKQFIDFEVLVKLICINIMLISSFTLITTGKILYLISPKYRTLLVISVFIMIFFSLYLVSVLFKDEKKSFNILRSDFIMITVINIFLISVLISPDFSNVKSGLIKLKGFDIERHSLSYDELDLLEQKLLSEYNSMNTVSDRGVDEVVFTDENFSALTDDIYLNFQFYDNRHVKIKGFIYQIPAFDGKFFAVSRLLMICCAADAVVTGIPVDKGDIDHIFAENQWYEISGVFQSRIAASNGKNTKIPVIKLLDFKELPGGENPFVYRN